MEPGYVDLQVNGGFGHDFTADPASIWAVASGLAGHGVGAFLPTLVSAPFGAMRAADAVLEAGPPPGWRGARPLGLHLEGPALSPALRGAHPVDRLIPPTAEVVDQWLSLGSLRMVTIAPELPGAIEAIGRLTDAGVVVSLGHTGASGGQVRAAIDAGARMVTHLFNAMAPFHHRDPGVVGAALTDERVALGLIGDGVHVAPEAIDLVWRAAGPGRIVLTTDAVAAMGTDAVAAVLGDGTLAGGATSFDEVVRVVEAAIGRSVPRAMTRANALTLLGEDPA